MIRVVIFDCFGVIITDALQALVNQLPNDGQQRAKQVSDILHAGNRGLITIDETHAKIAEVLGMSVATYRQKLTLGEVRDQATLDFAASLRPKYKTALLSNVSGHGLQRRFMPGELERYFNVVVASGDIGFAKPEAQAYEAVAERLGVRCDECVMVDDRSDYCNGAQAVGMQSVLFQNLEQLRTELAQLL